MKPVVLRTYNLTKRYGKSVAVDHVSLVIEEGDIFGFVGENGAGKTTFMRMICGLVRPSSGSIELFGKSGPKSITDARRSTGSIIEHPAIYPNMSAFANLEVQSRYLGLRINREKMCRLLELTGLSADDRKKAGNYSMGMKQRLGIAMALLGNPGFLLLDEPTVGLDPLGVAELRELLKRIHTEKNVTMLISSHNLNELEKLSNKFGVMHQGRLLETFTDNEMRLRCEKESCDLESLLIGIIRSAGKNKEVRGAGK